MSNKYRLESKSGLRYLHVRYCIKDARNHSRLFSIQLHFVDDSLTLCYCHQTVAIVIVFVDEQPVSHSHLLHCFETLLTRRYLPN